MADIPILLDSAQRGDPRALDDLLPLVDSELRALARAKMSRELPGHTLQSTAVVH